MTNHEAVRGSTHQTIFAEDTDATEGQEALNWEQVNEIVAKSPYVFETDRFAERIGEELHEEHKPKECTQTDLIETFTDSFQLMFEPDLTVCEHLDENAAKRAPFIKEAMESPNMEALRTQTMLDPEFSRVAAEKFAQTYIAYAEKQAQLDAAAQRNGLNDQQKADRKALAQSMGVENALQNAKKEVQDAADTAAALGIGSGSGEAGAIGDGVKKWFSSARKDPVIRRIAEFAGRFRRMAEGLRRTRSQHGQDECVGIELGNSIPNLCPAELCALGIADLEWHAMRKFAERGMQQRSWNGAEPKKRGPMIILVDESGSMEEGEKILAAKGLACALIWIARKQKRDVVLIGFNHEHEIAELEQKTCMMRAKDWFDVTKLQQVEQWMQRGADGGTSFPAKYIPTFHQTLRQPADVITISDGCWGCQPEDEAQFNKWRQTTQTRMITLLVGVSKEHGQKAAIISNEVHFLTNLSTTEQGVERVLTI